MGVATGDIGIYTPKISPSKLFMGKNDVRTAIEQFYTPPQKKTNFYTPKTNFWLRPYSDSPINVRAFFSVRVGLIF